MRDHNEDLWKLALVLALGAIILLIFMSLVLPGKQPQELQWHSESIELTRMFDRVGHGIVLCGSSNSKTTGFFVSKDGWIITAGHKVDRDFPRANKIHIRLSKEKDAKSFIATEVTLPPDGQLDLLLLKINCKPKYYFKHFRRPYLYEENWIFGFRGTSGKVPSVAGYVSHSYSSPYYLLTTARTWYGNSGSPVVNRKGGVLGVAIRITPAMDGLFIPGDIVKKFINESRLDKKDN